MQDLSEIAQKTGNRRFFYRLVILVCLRLRLQRLELPEGVREFLHAQPHGLGYIDTRLFQDLHRVIAAARLCDPVKNYNRWGCFPCGPHHVAARESDGSAARRAREGGGPAPSWRMRRGLGAATKGRNRGVVTLQIIRNILEPLAAETLRSR